MEDLSRSIEFPGESLSEAEAAMMDPPPTAEQEAEFQQRLAEIKEAEQLTDQDRNINLG